MARKTEPDIAPDAAPERAWFKNVSPLGALEVPAVGRVIQPGQVFEVRPDIAELLAGQEVNFAPATQDEFDAWTSTEDEEVPDGDAA